jgi:hypothetical protein
MVGFTVCSMVAYLWKTLKRHCEAVVYLSISGADEKLAISKRVLSL